MRPGLEEWCEGVEMPVFGTDRGDGFVLRFERSFSLWERFWWHFEWYREARVKKLRRRWVNGKGRFYL